MVKKTPLLLFIVFLFSVAPASSVWESSPQELYLTLGNNAFIGDVNIKVIGVDVEGEEATVTVKRGKEVLYQGIITKKSGFEDKDVVRVRAKDFRYYDPARPEVLLDAEKWVEAKITKH